MRKTIALVLVSVVMSGCHAVNMIKTATATPEELSAASNNNLCLASVSALSSAAIDEEIRKRGIDCAPYIAARQRSVEATQDAISKIRQPAQRPIQTNCNTIGNQTSCTTY